MDWLTAVTKIVESIAWPVVAISIVITLRQPIAAVLARITALKGFGVEANLEKEIANKTAAVIEQGDKALEAIANDKPQEQMEAISEYKKAKDDLTNLIAYRSQLLGQLPSQNLAAGLPTLFRIAVPHFGADYLAKFTPEQLVAEWPVVSQLPGPRTGYPLNAGILAGLRASGVVNENNEITLLGAKMLINAAEEAQLSASLANKNIR